MSGRAIKAKCWIITTIKAEADITGQVKYDWLDCKITEGENALSVLADKTQTQEKWMDRVMSEGDMVWCYEDNLSFLSEYRSYDCDFVAMLNPTSFFKMLYCLACKTFTKFNLEL